MKLNYILLLVFLTTCLFLNKVVLSDDTSVVNLIVDINGGNNNYLPGQPCGVNSTFTCNNIGDAIVYFNKIVNNTYGAGIDNVETYQLLNIQLSDGIYGITGNEMNIYKYNLTISPLISGSTNVTFDGTLFTSNYSLITIDSTPSIASPLASINGTSSLTITGISFINFQQFALLVNTSQLSNTYITLVNCVFSNFTPSVTVLPNFNKIVNPLISINPSYPNTTIPINSELNILNCNFKSGLLSNSALLSISNSVVTFYNVTFDSFIKSSSLIYLTSSKINVNQASFSNCGTSSGVFQTINSTVTIQTSNFTSNSALKFGAAIQFETYTGMNSFTITYCNFINNAAGLEGGAINANYNQQLPVANMNSIGFSNFINNTAGINGGAVYSSNAPITIVSSNFTNNYADSLGDVLSLTGTSITFSSSQIVQTTKPSSSRVTFDIEYSTSAQFLQNYYNIQLQFNCVSSNVTLNSYGQQTIGPMVVCSKCNFKIDNAVSCDTSTLTSSSSTSANPLGITSTSSSSTTSNSGHHDGSSATKSSPLKIVTAILLPTIIALLF